MVGVDELRSLTDSDLSDRARDLREQLFKLRFQKTTGQIESAGKLSPTRRDLARVLTIQRERQVRAARANAAKA